MFSVIAGNYCGGERNCKYSSDFETIDEAIKAYDSVSNYSWAYIEYKGRYLDVLYDGYNPI